MTQVANPTPEILIVPEILFAFVIPTVLWAFTLACATTRPRWNFTVFRKSGSIKIKTQKIQLFLHHLVRQHQTPPFFAQRNAGWNAHPFHIWETYVMVHAILNRNKPHMPWNMVYEIKNPQCAGPIRDHYQKTFRMLLAHVVGNHWCLERENFPRITCPYLSCFQRAACEGQTRSAAYSTMVHDFWVLTRGFQAYVVPSHRPEIARMTQPCLRSYTAKKCYPTQRYAI